MMSLRSSLVSWKRAAAPLAAGLGLMLAGCGPQSETEVAAGVYQARVDNPFSGVTGYVNPDWKAKAERESGGNRVSNVSTAIWMDTIGAITAKNGGTTLQQHFDNAVSQGAGYIEIVIYDLPGRDCAALASNGELGPTELSRYKSEYIDAIAAIEGNSKYANLRIINIIEPDSLPNLTTNVGTTTATDACATMKSNGNYVAGVQYALSKLYAIGNTYNYVDIGHHGWLGWADNQTAAAKFIADAIKGATGGANTVQGFISNTANYCATVEPYFTASDTVGGTAVKQSTWVDWNQYVDEQSFDIGMRSSFISNGMNSNIGMLIDTSRNGWGGSKRPTKKSSSTTLDTYVDESRIDRRIHLGNWCNQSGAGLGERPKAVGSNGVHAYVWIKPPGDSDGSSTLIPQGSDNPDGKGFDQMCDPSYGGNTRNKNNKTGSLSGAPVSGVWFSAQFQELMTNAYPPL